MSRPAQPLPAELGDVFTTAEATAVGVGYRRLQRPDVERLAFGVYARLNRKRPTPSDPEILASDHPAERWADRQRECARLLAHGLPRGHFFSRRTAAVLWRLPVPAPENGYDDDRLDVSCFHPQCPTRDDEYRSGQVRPHLAEVVMREGIPTTDPLSTWLMLAPKLTVCDGIALGDAVIHRPRIPGTNRLKRAPYATLEELEHALQYRARPGNRALRRQLARLSSRSASAPETHLRLLLIAWGLAPTALDHDVYDPEGNLLGCSEFAYPEYRLVIEYEGSHHRTESRQWNRDIEKYRDYRHHGWEVLQVTADMLYRHPEELREFVLEALIRRGWTPGV